MADTIGERILGIESSCDETAAAVVAHGRVVCSNVVASQVELHAAYGGVFPEMASRQHVRDIVPVVRRAMSDADVEWCDLSAIAVTYGPGLTGSLLVGVNAAKGLSMATGLPLVAVNHLEGHLYSNWLHRDGVIRTPAGARADRRTDAGDRPRPWADANAEPVAEPVVEPVAEPFSAPVAESVANPFAEPVAEGSGEPFDAASEPRAAATRGAWFDDPPFPHLALIASGGHTDLVHVRDHGSYSVLGSTKDDAAGEAFDKVARMLDLGYPGGPAVMRVAEGGDPTAYRMPVADLDSPLDFSFSGLKTAVLRIVERERRSGTVPVADIAASFQAAAIAALVRGTTRAVEQVAARCVLLAGGVSANVPLRNALQTAVDVPVVFPPLALCTDNAAMIAAAGHWLLAGGAVAGLDLDVLPGLRLGL